MSVERLFCAVCPGQLKIRLKLFYFTFGLSEGELQERVVTHYLRSQLESDQLLFTRHNLI